MTHLRYSLEEPRGPFFGLVVLQADETIEQDFRRLLPAEAELNVTRVPSGLDVTTETLAEMADHLTAAATLLPRGRRFDAVGYGCTSGSAVIGPERVADLVHAGAEVGAVTQPLSALIAACEALSVRRLAFLSPYLEAVSDKLRGRLAGAGIATPVFGSFDEAEEAKVVRISGASIMNAATALLDGAEEGVDALFLSCTNLRTLDVIAPLEARLGMPVLSSNQVLVWHMCRLAGIAPVQDDFGRLMGA